MSVNSVSISGNLTSDCELKQTQTGTSIGGFCVAINEKRKDNQSGEWTDYTHFIDCTLFGKRADSLSQYLLKGTKVFVTGKLNYQTWHTQEGNFRSKIGIIVSEIDICFNKQNQDSQQENYSDSEIPF